MTRLTMSNSNSWRLDTVFRIISITPRWRPTSLNNKPWQQEVQSEKTLTRKPLNFKIYRLTTQKSLVILMLKFNKTTISTSTVKRLAKVRSQQSQRVWLFQTGQRLEERDEKLYSFYNIDLLYMHSLNINFYYIYYIIITILFTLSIYFKCLWIQKKKSLLVLLLFPTFTLFYAPIFALFYIELP